jgi:hypothetical protein
MLSACTALVASPKRRLKATSPPLQSRAPIRAQQGLNFALRALHWRLVTRRPSPKHQPKRGTCPKATTVQYGRKKKKRAREVDARYSREKEAEAPNILHTLKFVPMAFPLLFFLLFLVAMPFKGSGKASRFFLVFDCGTFVAGVAY